MNSDEKTKKEEYIDSEIKVNFRKPEIQNEDGLVFSYPAEEQGGVGIRLLVFIDEEAKMEVLRTTVSEILKDGLKKDNRLVLICFRYKEYEKLLKDTELSNSWYSKCLYKKNKVVRFSPIQSNKIEVTVDWSANRMEYYTGDKGFAYSGYVYNATLWSILEMYKKNGDAIFDKNIRYGIEANKKRGIYKTLKEESNRFWYYNNGITILTEKHEIIDENKILLTEGIQVINGAQTITQIAYYELMTDEDKEAVEKKLKKTYVLLRVLEHDDEDNEEDDWKKITNALNNQRAVKLQNRLILFSLIDDIQKGIAQINSRRFSFVKEGEEEGTGKYKIDSFLKCYVALEEITPGFAKKADIKKLFLKFMENMYNSYLVKDDSEVVVKDITEAEEYLDMDFEIETENADKFYSGVFNLMRLFDKVNNFSSSSSNEELKKLITKGSDLYVVTILALNLLNDKYKEIPDKKIFHLGMLSEEELHLNDEKMEKVFEAITNTSEYIIKKEGLVFQTDNIMNELLMEYKQENPKNRKLRDNFLKDITSVLLIPAVDLEDAIKKINSNYVQYQVDGEKYIFKFNQQISQGTSKDKALLYQDDWEKIKGIDPNIKLVYIYNSDKLSKSGEKLKESIIDKGYSEWIHVISVKLLKKGVVYNSIIENIKPELTREIKKINPNLIKKN